MDLQSEADEGSIGPGFRGVGSLWLGKTFPEFKDWLFQNIIGKSCKGNTYGGAKGKTDDAAKASHFYETIDRKMPEV